MLMIRLTLMCWLLLSLSVFGACTQETYRDDSWKPVVDWGHWRLGHRSDPEFLTKNNFTVTFGQGAPNFESVTRDEFNTAIEEAKAFNKEYHDKGYIVLRYLSTSLNGESESGNDQPRKEQIQWSKFYNERWGDFEDYIGPKPDENPTTWITVHPDGSFPHYRYAPYGRETDEGFETWGCPDNPDYARMMEGRIRAQAETGIDGSYVDWTHIAGGTCYCEYTRQRFRKYLKENLPAEIAVEKYGTADYETIDLPEHRGDRFWMEWITYRGYVVADFHKRLQTVARKYNPSFLISGNVFGGFGYGPIAYDAAGNIEMLGREGYDDFIYSEMQEFLDSAPRKDENGVRITNSPALKFLSGASHGKPVIVYATEITPPIFPNPTEQCLSAMAQINIAESVANHTIFREKRETPPGATEIYQFISANEDYLIGAHLYSNLAVLASLKQFLADELSFAFSTSRVLADKGISHVLILEDDLLTDFHKQFDLIILPYIPLLSSAKQNALVSYVENGGIVLLLGECGQKDPFNVRKRKIELAESFDRQRYPDQYTVQSRGLGNIAFIPLEIPESRFLISSKEKGEFTTFGPTMSDLFPDIPGGYTRGRIDPELYAILSELSDKAVALLNGRVTRLGSKSPYVEISSMLQEDKDRMLVHLVNYDVTIDGKITPATNIQADLLLPEGKGIKSLIFDGQLKNLKPIEYKAALTGKQRQVVSFTADKVNVYGLAVAQLE